MVLNMNEREGNRGCPEAEKQLESHGQDRHAGPPVTVESKHDLHVWFYLASPWEWKPPQRLMDCLRTLLFTSSPNWRVWTSCIKAVGLLLATARLSNALIRFVSATIPNGEKTSGFSAQLFTGPWKFCFYWDQELTWVFVVQLWPMKMSEALCSITLIKPRS